MCLQVLLTVSSVRTTSQCVLRAAPRWGEYVSVAVGFASNVALQGAAIAVAALPKRGGHYIWRSSQRRITGSCVLLAMHAALLCAVFTLRRRIAARVAAVSAAGELEEGHSNPNVAEACARAQ